jgi:hypothetical protein
LSSVWNLANTEIRVRRAASLVARRDFHGEKDSERRLEDLARRLVEAGVVNDQGNPTPRVDRLERGTSLCCDRELKWSRRRLAYVFLGLEELLHAENPAVLHPDLTFGETGVRQFLSLRST